MNSNNLVYFNGSILDDVGSGMMSDVSRLKLETCDDDMANEDDEEGDSLHQSEEIEDDYDRSLNTPLLLTNIKKDAGQSGPQQPTPSSSPVLDNRTNNNIDFNKNSNENNINNKKPKIKSKLNKTNDQIASSIGSYNFILKAINRRKLKLSCPLCSSSVLNMSDHLVKKHLIKDRIQRKNLMDIVRKTYLISQKNQNSSNLCDFHIPTNEINSSSNPNTSDEIQDKEMPLNEKLIPSNYHSSCNNNRKLVRCPICCDDNKYFVNISDHLIKIHHLINGDMRKPVLKVIKQYSSSYVINDPLNQDNESPLDLTTMQTLPLKKKKNFKPHSKSTGHFNKQNSNNIINRKKQIKRFLSNSFSNNVLPQNHGKEQLDKFEINPNETASFDTLIETRSKNNIQNELNEDYLDKMLASDNDEHEILYNTNDNRNNSVVSTSLSTKMTSNPSSFTEISSLNSNQSNITTTSNSSTAVNSNKNGNNNNIVYNFSNENNENVLVVNIEQQNQQNRNETENISFANNQLETSLNSQDSPTIHSTINTPRPNRRKSSLVLFQKKLMQQLNMNSTNSNSSGSISIETSETNSTQLAMSASYNSLNPSSSNLKSNNNLLDYNKSDSPQLEEIRFDLNDEANDLNDAEVSEIEQHQNVCNLQKQQLNQQQNEQTKLFKKRQNQSTIIFNNIAENDNDDIYDNNNDEAKTPLSNDPYRIEIDAITNNNQFIWSRLINMENKLNHTIESFNLMSENVIKQIKTFSNQLKTTCNEINILKAHLLNSTNIDGNSSYDPSNILINHRLSRINNTLTPNSSPEMKFQSERSNNGVASNEQFLNAFNRNINSTSIGQYESSTKYVNYNNNDDENNYAGTADNLMINNSTSSTIAQLTNPSDYQSYLNNINDIDKYRNNQFQQQQNMLLISNYLDNISNTFNTNTTPSNNNSDHTNQNSENISLINRISNLPNTTSECNSCEQSILCNQKIQDNKE